MAHYDQVKRISGNSDLRGLPVKKLLAALLMASAIPFAYAGDHGKDGSGWTRMPWDSYGVEVSDATLHQIHQIKIDQQKNRYLVNLKYIARLPAAEQESMAKEMAQIDADGDLKINALLTPEQITAIEQGKLKRAEHRAEVAEFREWKAAKAAAAEKAAKQ